MGASIELLLCYNNPYTGSGRLGDSPPLQKVRLETHQDHNEYLENLADPIRAGGTAVKTAAISGQPLHEVIVRHATDRNVDLVLKDAHDHTALSRALFTHTDWHLIRSCPMPLWLAKSRQISGSPRFLAAIDPLHANDKPAALDDYILMLSKSIADKVGGEVHAFHSYDPRIALAAATANAYLPVSMPIREIEEQAHEEHLGRFREITHFHKIGDDHTHLVAGSAHEELPRIAKSLDAAVVVMGAIARSALKRMMIGATAERTLERLPCDLLVVNPNRFRATKYALDNIIS